MVKLEDFFDLIEEDHHKIKSIWKGIQIGLMFVAVVGGIGFTYCFGMLIKHFNNHCFLFAHFFPLTMDISESATKRWERADFEANRSAIYDESNINQTAMTKGNTKPEFQDASEIDFIYPEACHFVQFSPLGCGIFSLVWITFFWMCGKGGNDVKNGLKSPWRIIGPTLVITLSLSIVMIVSLRNYISGIQSFCENYEASFFPLTCQAQLARVANIIKNSIMEDPEIVRKFGATTPGEVWDWIMLTGGFLITATSAWCLAFVFILVRMIAIVDFHLIRVSVHTIEEDEDFDGLAGFLLSLNDTSSQFKKASSLYDIIPLMMSACQEKLDDDEEANENEFLTGNIQESYSSMNLITQKSLESLFYDNLYTISMDKCKEDSDSHYGSALDKSAAVSFTSIVTPIELPCVDKSAQASFTSPTESTVEPSAPSTMRASQAASSLPRRTIESAKKYFDYVRSGMPNSDTTTDSDVEALQDVADSHYGSALDKSAAVSFTSIVTPIELPYVDKSAQASFTSATESTVEPSAPSTMRASQAASSLPRRTIESAKKYFDYVRSGMPNSDTTTDSDVEALQDVAGNSSPEAQDSTSPELLNPAQANDVTEPSAPEQIEPPQTERLSTSRPQARQGPSQWIRSHLQNWRSVSYLLTAYHPNEETTAESQMERGETDIKTIYQTSTNERDQEIEEGIIQLIEAELSSTTSIDNQVLRPKQDASLAEVISEMLIPTIEKEVATISSNVEEHDSSNSSDEMTFLFGEADVSEHTLIADSDSKHTVHSLETETEAITHSLIVPEDQTQSTVTLASSEHSDDSEDTKKKKDKGRKLIKRAKK